MAPRIGCAILDADCAAEVFGRDSSEAGEVFRQWVTEGQVRLMYGAGLREELGELTKFTQWAASRPPTLRYYGEPSLREVKAGLEARRRPNGEIRSNDTHVLAIAIVSGARLLYSRDKKLRTDFTNRNVVSEPQGRLYNTGAKDKVTPQHRLLLRQAEPCE